MLANQPVILVANILTHQQTLKSVTTDSGKRGETYYVTDGPGALKDREYQCEQIIVSMENGSMAAIPFAVCIRHDQTVVLVNLTKALKSELVDKVPRADASGGIILPRGLVSPPEGNVN